MFGDGTSPTCCGDDEVLRAGREVGTGIEHHAPVGLILPSEGAELLLVGLGWLSPAPNLRRASCHRLDRSGRSPQRWMSSWEQRRAHSRLSEPVPSPFPSGSGAGMVLEGLKAKLRRWGRRLCCSLLLLLYVRWPACLTPPLRYRLVFGMLYPAYASYKAVKTKNIREYVSRVPGQLFPRL